MKFKNETQARERLKYVLDGYIEAFELQQHRFYIDFESDPEIAEWTDEELEKGDGYLMISSIESYSGSKSIHVNTVGYIAYILNLTIHIISRKDNDYSYEDYPYECWVEYKGYKFFDLYTDEDMEKEKEIFDKCIVKGRK